MKLTTTIDVTLKAGQNNCEMPRVRAIRAEKEREATKHALWQRCHDITPHTLHDRPDLGARVTCHRPYEMQPLDNDNLSGSFKYPRDEVAAFLGVDDSTDRIHWIYTQAKAERTGVKQSKPGWKKVKDKKTGEVTRVRKVVKNVAAYDTRPTITIEVMPVGDIDPQAKRVRELEAAARGLLESLVDVSQRTDDDEPCYCAEMHDEHKPWCAAARAAIQQARRLLGMVTTSVNTDEIR